MNSPRLTQFTAILVALTVGIPLTAAAVPGCAACCASGAPASLPDESTYNLTATWQNQMGEPVTLADFAGQPVIITMVFTHCAYACPRIIADLQAIRAALPGDARDDVRFVLASFDTARDTPERLHSWAAEQKLGAGWTLLHGDADAVRALSVVLDIPFVPQPDGSFGHGNRIVLLNDRGVAVTALAGLGADPAPIVAAAASLSRHP